MLKRKTIVAGVSALERPYRLTAGISERHLNTVDPCRTIEKVCGVAGILGPENERLGSEIVAGILHGLGHRGPDAVGRATLRNATLGFTRLAVIDVDPRSNQPIRYGSLALVFNGEVYNYREIRCELERAGHVFETSGDAEVLIHAWSEWAEACIPRLIGMFAFALVDEERQLAFLVRDAFGIKPLFHASEGRNIVFASDPVVVARSLRALPPADDTRVMEFLVRGRYDHGEQTFYAGIKQVPPASLLEVDLHTGEVVAKRRWWWPSIVEVPTSADDAACRLRELFLDSVRFHLRTDVPWGVALSGGIDSSSIACAAREVVGDAHMHAFAFAAPGFAADEGEWISLVSDVCDASTHLTTAAEASIGEELDDLVMCQGEPFGSTSIYAQYRVFKRAREAGVTVVLEGQGADELFAGYSGYPGQRVMSMLEGGHVVSVLRFLHRWRSWPERSLADAAVTMGLTAARGRGPDLLYRKLLVHPEPWVRPDVLSHDGIRGFERPGRHFDSAGNQRRLAQHSRHTIIDDGLRPLLRHGDRNAMRWSVENRVPFLTCAIAEFALSLPEVMLVDQDGQTKAVLRKAMSDLVPTAVLQRRDKVGFVTPEQAWIGGAVDLFRTWVRDAPPQPYVDTEALATRLQGIAAGSAAATPGVWRALNLLRWLTLAPVDA